MIVACPYCKTQFDITDEMVGQKAQCTHCKSKFILGNPNPVQFGEDKCLAPSFLNLMTNEQVVLVAHPSWLNYFLHYFFGGIVLLVALIMFCTLEVGLYIFPSFMAIAGLLLLSIALVNGFTICYVITDKRIVAKKGLIAVNITEVRIDDIRGVNFSRGLWQAIIGTGDVSIGTAATGGAEIKIVGVGGANKLVDKINALRRG